MRFYTCYILDFLCVQLIIGAFVSGMDAGKIYNTWPLMGVNYFPDDSSFKDFLNLNVFDNPSIVQFIHRNLAYLIVLFYFYILFLALSNIKYNSVKGVPPIPFTNNKISSLLSGFKSSLIASINSFVIS